MAANIALNALSILNRSGTGSYVRALVNRLRRRPVDGAEILVILPLREDPAAGFFPGRLRFPDGVRPQWISGPLPGRRAGRVLAEQLAIPRLCAKLGADVLHSPTGVAPLSLPCASAVTLHDMAFRVFPRDFSLSQRVFVSAVLPRSARRADVLFTDSDWSRSEIHRLLRIPLESITVVPLGVDEGLFAEVSDADRSRVRAAYDLPDEFLLYLGTVEPRKNLVTLVRALDILRHHDPALRLVIAGRFGWKVRPLHARIEQLRLGDRVAFPGFIPEADLPALYRLARVFVYPSKYEGFGLPVLEAMACAKAVVASNRSSIPEIAGDAAVLTDVEDPAALAEAVRGLWDDEDRRQHLGRAARERARRFPWSRTADATFQRLVSG